MSQQQQASTALNIRLNTVDELPAKHLSSLLINSSKVSRPIKPFKSAIVALDKENNSRNAIANTIAPPAALIKKPIATSKPILADSALTKPHLLVNDDSITIEQSNVVDKLADSSDVVNSSIVASESLLPSKRPNSDAIHSSKRARSINSSLVSFPDLDADDIEDAGMCAEYAQDIMNYLFECEQKYLPDPNYISLHPDLKWKMRSILVDWLIEVHFKFKFLPETLFLGVNIMDRVLSRRVCEMSKLQLVGLTCLFIAAKTEEVFPTPVSQFAYMISDDFNETRMLEAEQYILRVLEYVFWAPGPFSFIRRISKVDDYNFNHRNLAKYLAEITLLDHVFLCFPPSLIAAASMWLARKLYGVSGWSSLFVFASGYTEDDFMPCVIEILKSLVRKHDNEPFFFQKYSGKRYAKAIVSAQQLLEEMKPIDNDNSLVVESKVISKEQSEDVSTLVESNVSDLDSAVELPSAPTLNRSRKNSQRAVLRK